jgi:AcrR family transcriptional regulator
MPRAKQRTPQLKRHVLEVSLELLESEGVEAFTTRRIAARAETSMPAVYELFGDKAGLVRALFFEGFRQLHDTLYELDSGPDPRADLVTTLTAYRAFARDHPQLTAVMFSRPFADFDPGPLERKAGAAVREFIVGRARRFLEKARSRASETDVAHVLLALVQGLAVQEAAGWLGTSRASVERRWALAVDALLEGLAPSHRAPGVISGR